jgi:molecular chaperone GrpE
MSRKDKKRKDKPDKGEGKKAELGEQISCLEDKLKRALADYDNLKKQTQKERDQFAKFATETLIENLVGIWEGLQLVTDQFYHLLSLNGFEEIKVEVGDDFDPFFMEAVASDGTGENVVEIINRGFKLHDKVIRPVKVRVGSKSK